MRKVASGPDSQPATQRGYLRFLVQMCELGNNRGIGIDPTYVPERTKSVSPTACSSSLMRWIAVSV